MISVVLVGKETHHNILVINYLQISLSQHKKIIKSLSQSSSILFGRPVSIIFMAEKTIPTDDVATGNVNTSVIR
jgi:hypothetical protein